MLGFVGVACLRLVNYCDARDVVQHPAELPALRLYCLHTDDYDDSENSTMANIALVRLVQEAVALETRHGSRRFGYQNRFVRHSDLPTTAFVLR